VLKLNRLRIGIVLLLLSSTGFASLSILTKLAYAEGGTVATVLVLRFALAAVVFSPLALVTVDRSSLSERLWIWVIVAVLQALSIGAFWLALKLETVSEVAPIVYLFPGIVILIERFVYHEMLTPSAIVAVCVGITGSILVLGKGALEPIGIVAGGLAFLSATGAATVYVITARKVRRGDQMATVATVVLFSVVVFGLSGAIVGLGAPSSRGWILMGAIAVIGALIPYPYIEGITRVGASRAAMLSVYEPLLIVTLAVVVLRETIGVVQGAGIGMILAGFVVASHWVSREDRVISRA
jgi:drug/metabolite transporter (DMT)-like permease